MSELRRIRVGVDVGGTFTKAVAMSGDPLALRAHAVTPTTHGADDGVSEGVATVLADLLAELGPEGSAVELVAYSTTTAMNALLEGDVPKVGIVGIGARADARLARRRTHVGDIGLAPGKCLRTEHAFLDAADCSDAEAVDAVLDRLQEAGCEALAVSGAFSVDDAEAERAVTARARARGLAVCAGHELTGRYGLETRTVSAAINASIVPLVERTVAVVEDVLKAAGIEVPLLVLKGDGGSMTLSAFQRTPSHTIGSGPAAGVAAALHQLGLSDGLVLECGGTSSNVSIIKRGRAVLRTLRVMERPTAIRTVDSWVIGAAGGSMARLGRRKVSDTGPRSAHVADLPYSSFAAPDDLRGAEAELIAPGKGDPDYAVLRKGERRWAVTATCASVALGSEASPSASREAARLAFEALGRKLRRDGDRVAREMLDRAVDKIARAVHEAGKTHDLAADVPVVALGGAGRALAPEVAERLGRPLITPEHPEVLSSIGAALSLIRTESVRTATGNGERLEVSQSAIRACVESGAAPNTVTVETFYEPASETVRAVATGAVALESGAVDRRVADDKACLEAAAQALAMTPQKLELVTRTQFYRVFSGNGAGGCAIVDASGAVPLAEQTRQLLHGPADELLARLGPVIETETTNLGLAELSPRVALVSGPSIIDLSDARGSDGVIHAAREVLQGKDEEAVAVVWS